MILNPDPIIFFVITDLGSSNSELAPLVGTEQLAGVDVDDLGLRVDADLAARPGDGPVDLGDDAGGGELGHTPTYRGKFQF